MRTRLFLVVALSLSAAALTSFAQTPSDSTATPVPTPYPTSPSNPTPNSPTDQVGSATSQNFDSFANLSDAEVLSVVCAIDGNEIDAAQYVQDSHHGKTPETVDKSSGNRVGDPVEDFAEMLRKDHEKNLKDAKALAKKMNLALSTTIEPVTMVKQKGMQDMVTLQSMTGTELERTYINAMIQGHQEALRIIDTMMPTATSAMPGSTPPSTSAKKNSQSVRDFLTQTRAAVAQHLAKAQEIESQLSLR